MGFLRAKNRAGDTALEGVENYILTKVEAFKSQVVSEKMKLKVEIGRT